MRWLGDAAPKGWDYWGLGKFIDFAKQRGLPDELADALSHVDDHRRVLAHLKDETDPASQWMRGMDRLQTAHQPRRELFSAVFMAVLDAGVHQA